jgi:hypothetical protein
MAIVQYKYWHKTNNHYNNCNYYIQLFKCIQKIQYMIGLHCLKTLQDSWYFHSFLLSHCHERQLYPSSSFTEIVLSRNSSWGFLGCNDMQCCSMIPIPSSRWRLKQQGPLKCWYPTTTLHSIIKDDLQHESSLPWKPQISYEVIIHITGSGTQMQPNFHRW